MRTGRYYWCEEHGLSKEMMIRWAARFNQLFIRWVLGLREPKLAVGEEVLRRAAATRVEWMMLSRTGRLMLTNRRLMFQPCRTFGFPSAGGVEIEVPLGDVAYVEDGSFWDPGSNVWIRPWHVTLRCGDRFSFLTAHRGAW